VVDVTADVAGALRDSGIVEGVCHLFVPHTTAGLAVNENADPDVKRDVIYCLANLVPDDPAFRHAEGNSDAHVKSLLAGCSLTVPVTVGRLELGTWGGIYFCEFDGPRRRKLHLRFVGEDAGGALRMI
jgi:secondary thiamine-phosphate synthase enzyme